MIDAQHIAEALEGKRSGKGWICKCPAHDDANPSLSISDGEKGPLVHCFAGCNFQAVVLSLRDRGLWPNSTPEQIHKANNRHYQKRVDHAKTVLLIANSDREAGISMADEDQQTVLEAQATITSPTIDELAALPLLEYDRKREETAKTLGVRTSTLDNEVKKARAGFKDTAAPTFFPEVEPWDQQIDGAELLNEAQKILLRYMVFPDHAVVAVVLWIIHTHAHDAARISALLAILSPEKRCGKTTLLCLLLKLTWKPMPASNISPAALFRSVEKWSPTLLIDEADTFLNGSDELVGIVNSGHTKDTAYVIRTVGDDYEPTRFSTWGAKAIALIGKLPPTLHDRSIVIRLRRKKPDESVNRLEMDKLDTGEILSKCRRWVSDNIHNLINADPEVPVVLHDRAADNWRPLLAIADAAGGEWPKLARNAAKALTPTENDDDAAGVILLQDIKCIFEEENLDRIASVALVDRLVRMEDRPWPEWRQGKPITVRQVARLFRPFEIKPKNIKIQGKVPKGYRLDDFDDAFARYLADSSATPLPHYENRGETDILCATDHVAVAIQSATVTGRVADEKRRKLLQIKAGSGVADKNPDIGVCPSCDGEGCNWCRP